jgi:hypothetical protein
MGARILSGMNSEKTIAGPRMLSSMGKSKLLPTLTTMSVAEMAIANEQAVPTMTERCEGRVFTQ